VAFVIQTIQNLENFRKQLNAILAAIFSTANSWTQAQTFPAAGIVIGTVKDMSGTGSPEGEVEAPVGSTFRRTDGGTSTAFYVKETGAATNTGWVAK